MQGRTSTGGLKWAGMACREELQQEGCNGQGWHAEKNFSRRVEMGGGGKQGRTQTGGLKWAGVACREELQQEG